MYLFISQFISLFCTENSTFAGGPPEKWRNGWSKNKSYLSYRTASSLRKVNYSHCKTSLSWNEMEEKTFLLWTIQKGCLLFSGYESLILLVLLVRKPDNPSSESFNLFITSGPTSLALSESSLHSQIFSVFMDQPVLNLWKLINYMFQSQALESASFVNVLNEKEMGQT